MRRFGLVLGWLLVAVIVQGCGIAPRPNVVWGPPSFSRPVGTYVQVQGIITNTGSAPLAYCGVAGYAYDQDGNELCVSCTEPIELRTMHTLTPGKSEGWVAFFPEGAAPLATKYRFVIVKSCQDPRGSETQWQLICNFGHPLWP